MTFSTRSAILILCVALSGTAFASNESIRTLESDIKSYQSQKNSLNQELEYTRSKLKEAQRKLANVQREQKIKEIQLEKMKNSLGNNPTQEQREFIANEKDRIELAETAIKSRKAAVNRLDDKVDDLVKKIERADTLSKKAQNQIAQMKDQNLEATRAANSAMSYRMQRELEELRKENEQLKIAMAEEAQRTRDAQEKAEQARIEAEAKARALLVLKDNKKAEEEAAKAAQQLAEAEEIKAKEDIAAQESRDKQLLEEQLRNAKVADASQVALPGEKPIYTRSDGRKVVIRNRGKRHSTVMMPAGKKIFKAEVVLEPGKSYFDVKRRRYRGYFPESAGTATYVFTYDLTDEDQPKLSVDYKNPPESEQMVSDAKDPY